MAQDQWRAGTHKLGGFPAIVLGTNRGDEQDLTLAGHYGEVWADGPKFKAALNGTACRRLRDRLSDPEVGTHPGLAPYPSERPTDQDCIITFTREYLPSVLHAIRYTSRRPSQARLANNRSK